MASKRANGDGKKKKGKAKYLADDKNHSYPILIQHSYAHQTKEFFNNSTLHGIRYIAEEGRPFRERYFL